jgi:hypothetical protein
MPAGGITPALNTDRHDIRLNLLSRNDDFKIARSLRFAEHI